MNNPGTPAYAAQGMVGPLAPSAGRWPIRAQTTENGLTEPSGV